MHGEDTSSPGAQFQRHHHWFERSASGLLQSPPHPRLPGRCVGASQPQFTDLKEDLNHKLSLQMAHNKQFQSQVRASRLSVSRRRECAALVSSQRCSPRLSPVHIGERHCCTITMAAS